MNWVDLVVLAVLALSGLLAFVRGLVREVLGLGAWVVAALIASSYGLFPYVQPWVSQQFSDPTTSTVVAFAGVFVIALIVLWAIAGAVSSLVHGSMLGGLDRTLGLVFGLVRGAALLAVVYFLVGLAIPMEQWPAPVLEARALPSVYRAAVWIVDQVPEQYRPKAPTPPPPGRSTTASALLQSSPTGRALGTRPTRD